MARGVDEVVALLTAAPETITFNELRKVCRAYFGEPRSPGSSHLIFKTGVRDPALVNIQRAGKMAKPYQCRQVARAIALLSAGGRR